MNFCARTDLACESMGGLKEAHEGIDSRMDCRDDFQICRVAVKTLQAAKKIGKPIGNYITVECGEIHFLSDEKAMLLSGLLADEISQIAKNLTQKNIDSDFGVFVAGLGNAELTADAIGPKTVGMLTATRHLREHEGALYSALGCSALSALAPGVLGQTGIETLELLREAVRCVRPDAVIVIDSLAARSCSRLASTVQITDVGIHPGSGVGNHREGITRETLGVPVIAVGVPTVVDSATLVYDALQKAKIENIDETLKHVLESGKSFFVSPKESDVTTACFSKILANAIGMAFTADFS